MHCVLNTLTDNIHNRKAVVILFWVTYFYWWKEIYALIDKTPLITQGSEAIKRASCKKKPLPLISLLFDLFLFHSYFIADYIRNQVILSMLNLCTSILIYIGY